MSLLGLTFATSPAIEKLENAKNSDCITTDDTAAAEAAVNSCVAAFVADIDPGAVQSKCGVGAATAGQPIGLKDIANMTVTSFLGNRLVGAWHSAVYRRRYGRLRSKLAVRDGAHPLPG